MKKIIVNYTGRLPRRFAVKVTKRQINSFISENIMNGIIVSNINGSDKEVFDVSSVASVIDDDIAIDFFRPLYDVKRLMDIKKPSAAIAHCDTIKTLAPTSVWLERHRMHDVDKFEALDVLHNKILYITNDLGIELNAEYITDKFIKRTMSQFAKNYMYIKETNSLRIYDREYLKNSELWIEFYLDSGTYGIK